MSTRSPPILALSVGVSSSVMTNLRSSTRVSAEESAIPPLWEIVPVSAAGCSVPPVIGKAIEPSSFAVDGADRAHGHAERGERGGRARIEGQGGGAAADRDVGREGLDRDRADGRAAAEQGHGERRVQRLGRLTRQRRVHAADRRRRALAPDRGAREVQLEERHLGVADRRGQQAAGTLGMDDVVGRRQARRAGRERQAAAVRDVDRVAERPAGDREGDRAVLVRRRRGDGSGRDAVVGECLREPGVERQRRRAAGQRRAGRGSGRRAGVAVTSSRECSCGQQRGDHQRRHDGQAGTLEARDRTHDVLHLRGARRGFPTSP